MAVLEDVPEDQHGEFLEFTMSGTIVYGKTLFLLANGDVDGVHRNVSMELTPWQIGYLIERLHSYLRGTVGQA